MARPGPTGLLKVEPGGRVCNRQDEEPRAQPSEDPVPGGVRDQRSTFASTRSIRHELVLRLWEGHGF
jgi:hypothetical protein